MRVVICDDIQKDRKIIRTALDAYAAAHPEYRVEIDEYGAAADVLHKMKEEAYDIALMDICMPGVSGMDAAEEMFAKNPEISIIFLTTSDEYAVEAFAMNATHYLLKPFTQEQFNAALDRAIKKTEDQVLLSLDCVNGVYRVRINEIVSIESQNHYLLVVLSSGETLRLRMRLSQMFEEIQKYPEFVKVGASYAINFDFVRSISGNSIEMQGGAKIPVPRRSVEKVQRAYMEYCRKEARK